MQKHTDLQKKFIMEKTTSDKILQEIVLYERGVDTSASFHTTSTNSLPQIKTKPAFAIDSKRKFSKQRRQQNRGGVDIQKYKTNHCRNCGFTPWSPTHDCPAKRQECRLYVRAIFRSIAPTRKKQLSQSKKIFYRSVRVQV